MRQEKKSLAEKKAEKEAAAKAAAIKAAAVEAAAAAAAAAARAVAATTGKKKDSAVEETFFGAPTSTAHGANDNGDVADMDAVLAARAKSNGPFSAAGPPPSSAATVDQPTDAASPLVPSLKAQPAKRRLQPPLQSSWK